MSENKDILFKLHRIFFPRIDGVFYHIPKSPNYDQSYRFYAEILDDTHALLLFGVSLTSDELVEGHPAAALTVEVSGQFELNTSFKKDITSLKDIPLSANMLALLFPFLREKVLYFFGNNHVQLILNPVNTIKIVNDVKIGEGLMISDRRNKTISTDQSPKPS